MSEIQAALSNFISSEFADNGQPVAADTNLLAAGLVDSIGMMRLIAFIDEQFKLSVPPEDVTIENFVSVEAMTGYIERQLAVPSEFESDHGSK